MVQAMNSFHSQIGLLSAREVQRHFGYTNSTAFFAFVRRAGVPCVRLNPRRIMFEPKAVEAWLRKRAVGEHPASFFTSEPQAGHSSNGGAL